MRTIVLLLSAICFAVPEIFACSFAQTSFCQNASEFEDELIVAGVITSVDDDGIDLDIIKLVRGNETRTTIRIWDGTDFDCNGWHSMAATNIGALNDTVIVMLPQIDSLENIWDEIGDYRTPFFWTESKILRVQDNVVKGFISGIQGSPVGSGVYDFNYDAFLDSWLQEMDCSQILSVDDGPDNSLSIFPNPTSDILFIESDIESTYLIYEATGNIVVRGSLGIGTNRMNIQQLPSGLYFFQLDESRHAFKILKAD